MGKGRKEVEILRKIIFIEEKLWTPKRGEEMRTKAVIDRFQGKLKYLQSTGTSLL